MDEKEMKIVEQIAKATYETVDLPVEQYEMIEKINYIYMNALQDYLNNANVVRFNFLEWLKGQTKGIETKAEFTALMETILETMETGKQRSRTEEIEYRLARKIYKDVAKGYGKKYHGDDTKIKVDYDGQEVEFDPFELKKDDTIVQ